MAAVPTALSYDKWSRIEGASSDEGEEARPLLGSSKSVAHHQADEQLYEAIKARFKAHFKGFAPLRQRKLLSRFAALQHRGVEPSNTYRYADIIGIVTQRHDELMDKSCVELLCKLHKELLKQADPQETSSAADPTAHRDAQVVMEAINTLEAVQRHPPVTALFERLCSPSSSPEARQLCKRYTELAFAKVALMRSVFGDNQATRDAEQQFLGEGDTDDNARKRGIDLETAAVSMVFTFFLLGIVWLLWRLSAVFST